ncbi:MAG: 50S ribosomal protein L4, partial [Omnitrophica bacterium RBG_13_46_9]
MKTKNSAQINKIALFDLNGKKVDTVELNKDVFNGKSNKTLLYQSILMYRSNQRRGTASTKTRANVRGGGKKPWRQKGTGRARVRSIRNPLW